MNRVGGHCLNGYRSALGSVLAMPTLRAKVDNLNGALAACRSETPEPLSSQHLAFKAVIIEIQSQSILQVISPTSC